jgi:hypothetical protein
MNDRVEIPMRRCLLCRHARGWVVDEHFLQAWSN